MCLIINEQEKERKYCKIKQPKRLTKSCAGPAFTGFALGPKHFEVHTQTLRIFCGLYADFTDLMLCNFSIHLFSEPKNHMKQSSNS